MNSTTEPQWWVAIDQKTQGPFSLTELASLVKTQKIGLQTMACAVNGQAWQPLAQITSLAKLFPAPQVTQQPNTPISNPYESTSLPQALPFRGSSPQVMGMVLMVAYFCLFWTPIYRGIQIVYSLSSIEGVTTELPTELFFMHFLIAKNLVFVAIGVMGVLAGLAWKGAKNRAVWLTCCFIALDGVIQWTAIWLVRLYVAAVTEFVETPGQEFATSTGGGVERFFLFLDLANLLVELMVLVWVVGWGRKQTWND